MKKVIVLVLLTLVLAAGAGIGGYFLWQSAGYLTTDNATVSTNMFTITSNMPGTLERFHLTEGQRVAENEVLGWVENGEALHSPVEGIVVYMHAVQGQAVSMMEPLAVIADTSHIHILSFIEETDVSDLHVGQSATVTIDALGNRQFDAYISDISRVTQAALTGQMMFFNTGGTFTRVTHLFAVEVTLAEAVDLGGFIGANARVRFPIRATAGVQPAMQPMETLQNRITVRGVVESVEPRNVYTIHGLMIQNVNVNVGDIVTPGQVLATLDTEDLQLTIDSQRAALEAARQRTQNALEVTRNMYRDASINLANNTNLHIIGAEAAVSAAQMQLTTARQNWQDAWYDYEHGNVTHILQMEAAVRMAATELEIVERNHENALILYSEGIIARDALTQSEDALDIVRRLYEDASVHYNNASGHMRRALQQAELMYQSAETAYQNARTMLAATRSAAGQEVDALRAQVVTAEIAADLEHLELPLQILENQLADATITAPVGGVITASHAREGAVGHGRLFTIEDAANLQVITRFREHDLGRIYEGMTVTISSDATGEYVGVISRINPAAVGGGLSPVVEFEAEILVTEAVTDLRIGMSVTVGIG